MADEEPKTARSAPAAAALIAVALVPGLLTVYFSLQSGGYFPGAPALVAAQLAGLIALRFALAKRPLEGVSPALLVAAGALAAFTAWILLSSGWSDSPARAVPEYTRALAYLLALVLFGILPFSARRLRWMLYGLAVAIVAVCVLAFLSRTVPDLVDGIGVLQPDRLSYPLDYWNSLGLLAGLGIILCGHLACASREHWAIRIAGAAAVPLLTAVLYYTFSRGATWASLAGVAIYVVVGRPRGLLAGALSTVPPTVVALMVVNPAGQLTSRPRFAPDTIAASHRTALAVLGCMAAAAAIRALLLRVDSGLESVRLAPHLRRPVLIGAGVATVIAALAASAALHVPDVVADKYRDFNSDEARVGDSGSSRLVSGDDNGRRNHWEVSVAAIKRHPVRGDGAGTYELDWIREREQPQEAHDGHSLYIETLGELGLVGLAALGLCLLVLLGGFAARARGNDRALFAALLAAGVAWALATAVDWDWEMPAVTIWLFAFGGAALARRARDRRARFASAGSVARPACGSRPAARRGGRRVPGGRRAARAARGLGGALRALGGEPEGGRLRRRALRGGRGAAGTRLARGAPSRDRLVRRPGGALRGRRGRDTDAGSTTIPTTGRSSRPSRSRARRPASTRARTSGA